MKQLENIEDDAPFEKLLKDYFDDCQVGDVPEVQYSEEEQQKIDKKINLAMQYRKMKKEMDDKSNKELIQFVEESLEKDRGYEIDKYRHSNIFLQAVGGYLLLVERQNVDEKLLDDLEKKILNAGENYLIPVIFSK